MRLSICIPTHQGRCSFLREAIDSVTSQLNGAFRDQIEICVSDNASEDGTRELVEQYMKTNGELFVYHRNERNMGQNFNLVKVIQIARGDFCWYMSSDDQIANGGIARILQLLEEYPDTTGITVNWAPFDLRMQTQLDQDRKEDLTLPHDPERVHVYRTADDIFLNLGLALGTMSRQIFNRKIFLEVIRHAGLRKLASYGTMVQFFINGTMAREHLKWIWCPEKLVKYRTGNFSLLQERDRVYYKMHLEIVDDASKAWADAIGSRSIVRRMESLGFRYMRGVPFSLKLQPSQTFRGDLAILVGFTKHWYFLPEFWLRVFPILLIPHFVVKAGAAIRSRLRLGTRLRAFQHLMDHTE